MGISLAHLRTLQEVSKRASFSKAARALGISQPAVSQQLALLSRTLGLPLFHRERGRLALTEAGRFVVGRADEMIADADRLVREVRGFAEAQSGRLNFATTRTIGTHLVPRLVAEFLRDRPAVEPHVRIANTHDVAALVADGEVLFGLVEGSIEDERIVTRPFARDHLRLIVAPGHRFAARGSILVGELAQERFVSREPGSGTRDHGYDALRAAGLTPPIALELPSGEGIVQAVEVGLGVALLSELVVDRALHLKRVVAVEIRDLALERDFLLAFRRDRPSAPLTEAFFTMLFAKDSSPYRRESAPHDEGAKFRRSRR